MEETSFYGYIQSCLLYGNTFCQVSRLVYIQSFFHCYIVSKVLRITALTNGVNKGSVSGSTIW